MIVSRRIQRIGGVCSVAALIAAAGSAVPSIAADLPFGKNVSAADRSVVVKLANIDAKEIDVSRDLDIAKIDLNGDGALDYVVVVNSQIYCGTGGCAASGSLSFRALSASKWGAILPRQDARRLRTSCLRPCVAWWPPELI